MQIQYAAPCHSISLEDQIQCFELAGFEWSQSLVCIAVQDKIILGIIKFPVKNIKNSVEIEIIV